MKPSEEILSKFMSQYLDETRNFGDEEQTILCENLFGKTKKLLTESKSRINGFKLLKELASNDEENAIVADFKLYVKIMLGEE